MFKLRVVFSGRSIKILKAIENFLQFLLLCMTTTCNLYMRGRQIIVSQSNAPKSDGNSNPVRVVAPTSPTVNGRDRMATLGHLGDGRFYTKALGATGYNALSRQMS